jgi:hypothetical protein
MHEPLIFRHAILVGKCCHCRIKMVISLVKLSFLFNSEITVFHRYLYNKIQFNSIQFKALFRVDINHTYNTSSNELLKSTMDWSVINRTFFDIGQL